MSMFIDLTQANGQPLDLPAPSIIFVEELDKEARDANEGAKCGLFYDVGAGLSSALVQEPFGKLSKLVLANRAAEFLEVRTANNNPALLMKSAVVALRGLPEEHPNDGKTQISHRVGPQVITLDVLDTRDQLREKIDG